jgi:hypothetical protein
MQESGKILSGPHEIRILGIPLEILISDVFVNQLLAR